MKPLAQLHATRPTLLAVLAGVVTVFAMVGLSRVEFDDDPQSVFRIQGAEFDALDRFYEDFGRDDQEVYLVIDGPDLFAPEAMSSLKRTYQALIELPEIDSVVGLFDVRRQGPVPVRLIPLGEIDAPRLERARREALSHPAAVGQFLSADGKTTLMIVRPEATDLPVSKLEPLLGKISVVVSEALGDCGLRFRLAGHPSARIDLLQTLRGEIVKFALLGALISAAIAWAVFRRAGPLLVSVTGPMIGVTWMLGTMGWLGIKIDPLSVILPTLLFVVGFTDAVHLVSDIQAACASGRRTRDASITAVEHLGPPCLITAVTTSLGFASLAIAKNECIRRFGWCCASGALVMFAAVQIVVPLLAARFIKPAATPNRIGHADRIGAALLPAYERLLNRPRFVAAISVGLTAVCFIHSLRLQADQRWTDSLPADSSTVEVTERCDAAFGGSLFAYVVVRWPEGLEAASPQVWDAFERVHKLCNRTKQVCGPISVYSLVESIRRPNQSPQAVVAQFERMPKSLLSRMLTEERRKAAVAVHVPDVGSAALEPAFSEMERELRVLRAEFPGFDFHLTGTVVVAARNVHQMITDLTFSLTLASVLVFVVMTVLFRSPLLGLLSVIPNLFPQALTAAILVWAGVPLTVTGVLTFSLCFGLSVDDTVHFLMRFREECKEGDGERAAVVRTFKAVGGVILATSFVLVGGFLAMLVSRMPAVRTFAALCCATLSAAIAGDLIMLPSLILAARKVMPHSVR